MRRFLPIILIAFAALFILPQLFKGGRLEDALVQGSLADDP
jgi:hypothetical protein